VGLGRIHVGGKRVRGEHAQDAEDELLRLRRVKPGQFSEGDVATVAVSRIGRPAAEDPVLAVTLSNVEPPRRAVGDQIYALD
jgi:hypothetical protein